MYEQHVPYIRPQENGAKADCRWAAVTDLTGMGWMFMARQGERFSFSAHDYTDEQLVAVLAEKGYNVARRTIAKYRDQLGIPLARLRKSL